MNLDHSRELLHDYARGELSDQDRAIVEEQLSNSQELRQELEMAKSYYAAIDEIDQVPVPAHFLENVHRRIDAKTKRSVLSRLLFPLHMKLPIEFAGVVATVTLIIFIFMPHLEKKNYSEYKPVITSDMSNGSSASEIDITGESVSAISKTEEVSGSELSRSDKKEKTVNRDKRSVAPVKQQSILPAPKTLKAPPAATSGNKMADEIKSEPAAGLLSEKIPGPASAPAASAPEPARQFVTEDNEVDKMEYTSAMPSVVQENELSKTYSRSEEQASGRKRKAGSFEDKRMKSRATNSEKYEAKEMASSMDLETTEASKDIKALLAKCHMKLIVKDVAGRTSTCSASGTPESVTSFLREIKGVPGVTLLKVVPENYSSVSGSVVVEFSVEGTME